MCTLTYGGGGHTNLACIMYSNVIRLIRSITSSVTVTHSEDGRFKIILAEKDTSLSGIIEEKGLVYKRGRAYYEFVRDNEIISEGKEVILMEQASKLHAESLTKLDFNVMY